MLFAKIAALCVVAPQLHLVLEVRAVAVDVPESFSAAGVLVSMQVFSPPPSSYTSIRRTTTCWVGLTLVDVFVRISPGLFHLLVLPLVGIFLLGILAELVRLRLQAPFLVDCGHSSSVGHCCPGRCISGIVRISCRRGGRRYTIMRY